MNAFFNPKYKLNYSKYIPSMASGAGQFLPGGIFRAANASSPLERARRSLAKDQARQQAKQTPVKPRPPEPKPEPPKRPEAPKPQPPKPQPPRKTTRRGSRKSPKKQRAKRTPVFTATLSGLLFSALFLLAAIGLYGAYCFSQGLPGDTNVKASTAIYCLSVFVGGFWASAVVKRKSVAPLIIIGCVYMLLSLLISWRLFEPASFKFIMIFEKILLTAIALIFSYLFSLIPYLINKAFKQRRKSR